MPKYLKLIRDTSRRSGSGSSSSSSSSSSFSFSCSCSCSSSSTSSSSSSVLLYLFLHRDSVDYYGMSTSSFTQLFSSGDFKTVFFFFGVALRPQRLYGLSGTGSPHSSCAVFSVALRPQRLYGLLGTGAQDVHLHFHTAPGL